MGIKISRQLSRWKANLMGKFPQNMKGKRHLGVKYVVKAFLIIHNWLNTSMLFIRERNHSNVIGVITAVLKRVT